MAKEEGEAIPKKPKLRIRAPKNLAQKTWVKASLTILAAFLMFGGPTYLIYVLQRLAIPYTLLILFGLASFIAGLILLTYLVKGKAEAEAS